MGEEKNRVGEKKEQGSDRGGEEVKRIHHFVGAMQTNTANKHTHTQLRSLYPVN